MLSFENVGELSRSFYPAAQVGSSLWLSLPLLLYRSRESETCVLEGYTSDKQARGCSCVGVFPSFMAIAERSVPDLDVWANPRRNEGYGRLNQLEIPSGQPWFVA